MTDRQQPAPAGESVADFVVRLVPDAMSQERRLIEQQVEQYIDVLRAAERAPLEARIAYLERQLASNNEHRLFLQSQLAAQDSGDGKLQSMLTHTYGWAETFRVERDAALARIAELEHRLALRARAGLDGVPIQGDEKAAHE